MPVGRPKAERQLSHCREAALSCQTCIAQSGRNLVHIAGTLDSAIVRQLFAAMYPEPNCQSLAPAFVQIVMREQAAKKVRIAAQMPRHAAVA